MVFAVLFHHDRHDGKKVVRAGMRAECPGRNEIDRETETERVTVDADVRRNGVAEAEGTNGKLGLFSCPGDVTAERGTTL